MKVDFSTIKKLTAIVFWTAILAAHFSISAQIPANRRGEIFEEVWNAVNEKYYDANFNGADWAAIRKKYQPQIEKSADENSFYALLDQMVGELRDSHTRVYSPSATARRITQKTTSVGLTIREVENSPVIFSVAPGSEAARRGIKAGMLVVAVNDQPIAEAISEARKIVGASSSARAAQMRVFSKILSGAPETPLTLELKNAAGEKQIFTLTRQSVVNRPPFVFKSLPSGIAYLKLPQFDEENSRKFNDALENFKNSRGLILDLRGNGGGDGDIGLKLAGHFLPDKITVARIVTRSGKPPLPEIPMTLETGGAASSIYSNPLVVLIDEGTASTAELIANALREQNRAVVFGTNSCGCVLAFLDYKKLTGGGSLTMSEFGFVTVKGKKLEGAGIAPDQIIAPTLEDLRAGRDAALEAAIKNLSFGNQRKGENQ